MPYSPYVPVKMFWGSIFMRHGMEMGYLFHIQINWNYENMP